MIKNINGITLALGVEYNGSNYHGWQIQKFNIISIQKLVEQAISIVAGHTVKVICSGRTDAKVHSIGQVIHFYTTSIRSRISWILGINRNLPNDISIQWVKKVHDNFHARYSAISRSYRYIIYNSCFRSSIFFNQTYHIYYSLDIQDMYEASQLIIGEYDFSSFRSKKCSSMTPYRKIICINFFKYQDFICIDIKANSFLQYMVRNIIGCLINIGKKKKNPNWIKYVLKKRNRYFCSPTASPNGLYLLSIDYPNYFKIPIIKVK